MSMQQSKLDARDEHIWLLFVARTAFVLLSLPFFSWRVCGASVTSRFCSRTGRVCSTSFPLGSCTRLALRSCRTGDSFRAREPRGVHGNPPVHKNLGRIGGASRQGNAQGVQPSEILGANLGALQEQGTDDFCTVVGCGDHQRRVVQGSKRVLLGLVRLSGSAATRGRPTSVTVGATRASVDTGSSVDELEHSRQIAFLAGLGQCTVPVGVTAVDGEKGSQRSLRSTDHRSEVGASNRTRDSLTKVQDVLHIPVMIPRELVQSLKHHVCSENAGAEPVTKNSLGDVDAVLGSSNRRRQGRTTHLRQNGRICVKKRGHNIRKSCCGCIVQR
mmetsp:Transcript_168669/g.409979  ORF Transcript_168669/g.409979 Transcript_168669/m.409979 type:complete len:330 (-) Transcript_168669:2235-3224(-)